MDLAFCFCGGVVFLTGADFFFVSGGRGSGWAAGRGAANGLWTSEARYWHTDTAAACGGEYGCGVRGGRCVRVRVGGCGGEREGVV